MYFLVWLFRAQKRQHFRIQCNCFCYWHNGMTQCCKNCFCTGSIVAEKVFSTEGNVTTSALSFLRSGEIAMLFSSIQNNTVESNHLKSLVSKKKTILPKQKRTVSTVEIKGLNRYPVISISTLTSGIIRWQFHAEQRHSLLHFSTFFPVWFRREYSIHSIL